MAEPGLRADASDWSAPDARGIRTRALDAGARSTLKARRQQRAAHPPQSAPIATWPAEWRQLATDWLRPDSPQPRWTTLLRLAGNARVALAGALLDALLELGWIALESRRERGLWQPQRLDWLDADGLREALGLPRRDHRSEQLAAALRESPRDPRLLALYAELPGLPAARALARAGLLQRLDAWLGEGRSGTRRDFALFARSDTKAVSEAEWAWLERALELDDCGIGRHLPALWLRAPLCLRMGEARLDLRAVPDAIALTPATLTAIDSVEGVIEGWRVLENRTSFERAARRFGEREGVLWVPGFAPSWWREAVARLLRHAPAPARIACDPDPAGIAIALGVAALWDAAGLAWQPWGMDAAALAALPAHKPLSEADRAQLEALRAAGLPPAFAGLAEAMHASGLKGEQEGLALD